MANDASDGGTAGKMYLTLRFAFSGPYPVQRHKRLMDVSELRPAAQPNRFRLS